MKYILNMHTDTGALNEVNVRGKSYTSAPPRRGSSRCIAHRFIASIAASDSASAEATAADEEEDASAGPPSV